MQASVTVARRLNSCGLWALERGLSGCGSRPQVLCGMWNLPGPGIKAVPLNWQVDFYPLRHQGNALF